MSVLIKGMEMPKCCADCTGGMYERNEHDELCFVCGFIKSQHQWECEHAEIDGIDTNKMRAYFCPIAEVDTPHWIPATEPPTEEGDYWATFDAETGRFVDWASWYQGRWVVWIDGSPAPLSNVIAWCKPMKPYKGVTE